MGVVLNVDDEDYPGQANDRRREEAIEKAVHEADKVIMEMTNGSVQETNYLTAKVAEEFARKVTIAMSSELQRLRFKKG